MGKTIGETSFVLRGDVLTISPRGELAWTRRGCLVCALGVSQGVFSVLPERFAALPVYDYGTRLILPGFVDLHTHAPQYPLCGTGMDLELIDWLNAYVFPEEARYADAAYAARAYDAFADALLRGATTSVCVFATAHPEAAGRLAEALARTGLRARVGLVAMDRNAPEPLIAGGAQGALSRLDAWLRTPDPSPLIGKILTPRFVPSCTGALLRALGERAARTGLPVQSHLSENPSEIAWVRALCPEAADYADVYARAGLLGPRTVMAHCVHSGAAERARLREHGVFVAHCPDSNTNLASGIAPVRRMLSEGLRVGLGTDVAGGHSVSMMRAVGAAVQVSKLAWRLIDPAQKPLALGEALWLATGGGGAFFGQVGTLAPGSSFDCVVLEDDERFSPPHRTPDERLERIIYRGCDEAVVAKFVAGRPCLQTASPF